ncbi:hypothetical protein DSC45_32045 [Streptomyces sp. YIM 130001]|uniref:hypothetical protein n=1 Tax=Streptomyces sp. YIM 130001 TaxID=2259644 RepID=UPI000E659568|nr:hypothetical protein [Streptomyces sp. YIM 130001]RII09157.1 hypothetical protein DSC45_32045 [Streptomyces sp. YIM 130001]
MMSAPDGLPWWYRTRHQVAGFVGYFVSLGIAHLVSDVSWDAGLAWGIPGAVVATVGHGAAKRRYETLHDLDMEGRPRDWA